ncbi:MAG: T9SS C-terminal target domain-containing protein, partial [Bacteroidetes bacterium]
LILTWLPFFGFAQDCSIESIQYELQECNDGVFYIHLVVDAANPGAEGFSVLGNGNDYGDFSYESTFIEIGPLEGNGETPYEFVVIDNQFEGCSNFIEVGTVDCAPPQCGIYDVVLDFQSCNEEGQYVYVLNFEYANTSNVGFDVFLGDDFLGFYHYEELPVTLHPFGPLNTDWFYLQVCDNDNPNCCSGIEVMTPDCPVSDDCFIENVVVEAHPCEEGLFYVDLEVQGVFLGTQGFTVHGNGHEYGTFSYEPAFVTIGPLEGDGETVYEFVVTDIEFPDCHNFAVIGPIDCNDNSCAFEMGVDPFSCNGFAFFTNLEQNVSWTVNGDWIGDAPSLDFEFSHPGEFEVCAHIETPDCPQGYSVCHTVIVHDDCFDDCGFEAITMNFEGCADNGSYFYALNFDPVNNISQHFDLYIQDEFFGFFAYEQLTLLLEGVGPFESEIFHVTICDNDNPDCCTTFEVETPSCGGGDCVINHVIVEAHECNDDGYFYVDLQVIGDNFGSEGFSVLGNGNDYGDFSYEEPYITLGPFAGDGESVYEFVVIDNQFDNCAEEAVIGPIDCFEDPCAFEIAYEEISCHNFAFFTSLDQNVSWFVNEEYVGFNEAFDFVTQYPGTYVICAAIETPDCPQGYFVCETVVVTEDCFGDCGFNDIAMNFEGCNDNGSYNYNLSFIPVNPIGAFFDLYIQNEFVGYYAYEDMPVWLEGVGPFESEHFVVKICDNDNPDCCQVFEVMTPDCGGNDDCVIHEVIVEAYECDEEGHFYVDLVVIGENFGAEGYKVVGNGNNYGNFSYDEPYITLGPFAGDGESVYEFVVIDNQFGDCSNHAVIGPIDCFPDDCGFHEIAMNFEGCNDNGSYNYNLSFIPVNPTNAFFDLYIQNEFVGYYAYEDMPVWLEGVGPFESEHFVVKICDNDNPDCCQVFEVMTPECGGGNGCNIWDVVVEPHIADCDNGIFSVDVAFNSSNTGLMGYYIFANGEIFGPFSYSLPFVTIGPFEGDGITQYDFLILDIMNPACFAYHEFGTFECDEDVWPGDTNSDNIANHFDLLNIGIAYGADGPEREDDNTEWDAMPANNWNQFFEDNINFKHADSNGDGVINESDISAIHQNFLFTHGDVEDFDPLPGTEVDPPVYMDVPDNLTTGVPFEIPVMLGTEGEPVNDIYGIAFSIELDPEVFNIQDIEVGFPTSWMGEPGVNLITFDRVDEESGTLYVAISRKDQNNVSGHGPIMYLHGIIDDIAGIHDEVNLKATEINAIDFAQNLIPLNNPFKTSVITKVRDEDTNFVSLLRNTWITPNPASGEIMIWNKNNVPIKAVTIYDMSGTQFGQTFTNTDHLSVESLPAGLYALKIEMGDHVIMKKLVKVQR